MVDATSVAQPTSIHLVTKDLEEMVHMVTKLFGRHTLLSTGPANIERSIQATSVGTLLVGQLQWGSNYHCDVREPSTLLALTGPGQRCGQIGGVHFGPGELLAIKPGWCGKPPVPI